MEIKTAYPYALLWENVRKSGDFYHPGEFLEILFDNN